MQGLIIIVYEFPFWTQMNADCKDF